MITTALVYSWEHPAAAQVCIIMLRVCRTSTLAFRAAKLPQLPQLPQLLDATV